MRTLLIPLVLLLAACGQKGPLYLPQDPAQPAANTVAPAPAAIGQPAAMNGQGEQDEEKKEQSQQNTEAEAVAK